MIDAVGASLWRDVIDQRVIDQVASRTGNIINSQNVYRDAFGVLPGIDDLPAINRPALWDTDQDGMPDSFESAHGLDANSAADRNLTTLSPLGYSNLEVYLDMAAAGLFVYVPLAGDYNGDHVVNAADYTVWRNLLGSNTPLTNETESLGVVDEADYDAWKTNFGATDGGDAGSAGVVPEPGSMVLLAIGLLLLPAKRRSKK